MKFITRSFLNILAMFLTFGSASLAGQAVYTPYPVRETGKDWPPEGYEAVYVSHFGRHGSRYLLKKDERCAFKVLSAASFGDSISTMRLRNDANALHGLYLGKEGQLSDLGVAEQSGIGRRLAVRLPELFGEGACVRARSSILGRCKASMRSFISGIRSVSPQIKACTSARLSDYRKFSHGVRHKKYVSSDPFLIAAAHYAFGSVCIGVDENLIIRHFSEFQQRDMAAGLESAFMCSLMPESPEEARCANGLMKDIVHFADAALRRGHMSSDLRFGHDSAFVPLGVLMGLNGFSKESRIGDLVPMGANIQLIFYRNSDGEVIVKILHNEVVTSVPELIPFKNESSGIYYKWPELRDYFILRMKRSNRETARTL